MITHVMRFDDLSAVSDVALTEAIVGILLKHKMPCTFAVIPFLCDPADLLNSGQVALRPFPAEKATLLKPLLDAGLAEVALHGYAHLTTSFQREHTEFSDAMPRDLQRKLIRAGREHLERVFRTRVHTFIPPWNRMGTATPSVLAEEGLLLSSGMEDGEAGPGCTPHLPCTVSIVDTRAALRTAQRRAGGTVGTMMHDHDIQESGFPKSMMTLAKFDRSVGEWMAIEGVRRQLISDAIRESDRDPERTRSNAQLRTSLRQSRVGRRLFRRNGLVYWDTNTARRLTRQLNWLF
jgi:peptidoglycan/xylan/chitin deacetylase (PgdA/CDA1 family)